MRQAAHWTAPGRSRPTAIECQVLMALIADLDLNVRALRRASRDLRVELDRALIKINAADAYRRTNSLGRPSLRPYGTSPGASYELRTHPAFRWI
ncbi:hypothetical protein E8L99_07285 [Phreatobacter aquaticus]|uniref:Uncharacterized protein n=1 Tax=Phreatobacter aquaticus TaxID=2570229 RepID=A0A4D7QFE5_9HYPH|nr:hypothetical protein [Phreatobacter aquaticus]QCK85585.1 hypothetical protein E8L99_07285 [Phreatobacter aquaticus]